MGKDHLLNMWEALWAGHWTTMGAPSVPVMCCVAENSAPLSFFFPIYVTEVIYEQCWIFILIGVATGILSSCPGRGLSCSNRAWLHQLPLQGLALTRGWENSLCWFQVDGFRVGAHNILLEMPSSQFYYSTHTSTYNHSKTSVDYISFHHSPPEVSILTVKAKIM